MKPFGLHGFYKDIQRLKGYQVYRGFNPYTPIHDYSLF